MFEEFVSAWHDIEWVLRKSKFYAYKKNQQLLENENSIEKDQAVM